MGCFIFLGILFYHLRKNYSSEKWKIHVLLLSCYITLCINLQNNTERGIMALVMVIFYLFAIGKLNWLSWKPLVFLGSVSFPLYLIHQNIGYVILNYTRNYLGNYPLVFFAFPVIIMILTAWLIHAFIEEPSIKLLRTWGKVPLMTWLGIYLMR